MTIMHSSSLEFKWVRLQHSFKHHTYSLIFLSLAFSLLHCSHLSCSVFILSLIQLHSPSSEVKMSPSGSLCVPSDTNGSLAVTAFVTVSRKGMSEVVAHQSKAFARHSQRASGWHVLKPTIALFQFFYLFFSLPEINFVLHAFCSTQQPFP